MSDCIFCKIVSGDIPADIVFEDEQVVVFKDINPKAEVHWLVIPRIHIESLFEVNESHSALMAHIMSLLPKLARQTGLEHGFRTILNTGPKGGQEVYHIHFHLLGGSRLPGFV